MSKPTSGKSGFVYIFMNPLFPNWVKIGKAKNWSTRLKNYQQYVPEDYVVFATLKTDDAGAMERLIHTTLKFKYGKERKSKEFFCVDVTTALNVLRNLAIECKQIQGLSEYVDGQVSAIYDSDGKRHEIPIDRTRGIKFRSSIKGPPIYMAVRNKEYVVLKGSELHEMTDNLKTSEAPAIVSIRRDREALESDPTRCASGRLLVDVPFKSSSRALAVMLGYSAVQGPKYWKDEEGRPLSDYLVRTEAQK